jgi:hypothetical protein
MDQNLPQKMFVPDFLMAGILEDPQIHGLQTIDPDCSGGFMVKLPF